MNILPPLPRQKLYTSLNLYLKIFFGLFSKNYYKENNIRKLEEEIGEITSSKYVVCVPQARIGIYLAIKSILKDENKNEVIMSPYTIYAVINMVISAGGIPVFVDIEESSCNIDPNKIEEKISKNTCAILVTHLHGLSCDLNKVLEIANNYNLKLIEDTAQSFGSLYNNRYLGSQSDIGVYSFGLMKNLVGFYGGALVTNDETCAQFIRNNVQSYPIIKKSKLFKKMIYGSILDFATIPIVYKLLTFWIFRFAYIYNIGPINMLCRSENHPKLEKEVSKNLKFRISNPQAKIILDEIRNVKKLAEKRIKLAKIYHKGLHKVPFIKLPPLKYDYSHTYMSFPIQIDNRDKFIKYMMKNNRDVVAQHLKNCSDLKEYSNYYVECPVARKVSKNLVLLPCYPNYKISEVRKNIEMIKKYERFSSTNV